MIEGANPLLQTFLGTLFTWGMTALGAGLVFIFSSGQRKILDISLGFAAGVMTAASFWSLLAPAIEMAEVSGLYGSKGQWAFIPVAAGFILGALFVFAADLFIPECGSLLDPANFRGGSLSVEVTPPNKDQLRNGLSSDGSKSILLTLADENIFNSGPKLRSHTEVAARQRRLLPSKPPNPIDVRESASAPGRLESGVQQAINWRRMLLLIIAITIHNIPEGLAVGVGFGAIGKTKAATFENARNLAFGIGIQNFPEGLAVSLPLRSSGMTMLRSFMWGQLSGMVEPLAGLLGALAVTVAEPILPYALAFAAGAMIYVVFDDIIPEAQTCGNGKLTSWGSILGFVVMMSLDVGLG
ncbi:Zinc transporter zip11-like [Plakobranchus ocellatus]|uniref:Zinc transporter ZIP11 n=1 Tax=Plakobranchus ocellatus TaxID=259542 RepID=A0AAV4CML2_9GAST|nr:Zinc transporter zip11-like [Plakobranchus ocellatus]